MSTRKVIAYSIAKQYFGCYLQPQSMYVVNLNKIIHEIILFLIILVMIGGYQWAWLVLLLVYLLRKCLVALNINIGLCRYDSVCGTRKCHTFIIKSSASIFC